jgi:hypothetical protein
MTMSSVISLSFGGKAAVFGPSMLPSPRGEQLQSHLEKIPIFKSSGKEVEESVPSETGVNCADASFYRLELT